MHRKSHDKGFTLIELMVVISIIVVLITLFSLGIPVIWSMVRKIQTTSRLDTLQTKITQFGYDLPDESEMRVDGTGLQDVDNSRFLAALQEGISGMTEDDLIDGWGNPIMYDRLWENNPEIVEGEDEDEDTDVVEGEDNDGRILMINATLPGHPVLKKCKDENWIYEEGVEMEENGEMQKWFVKYRYLLWSLGEDVYQDEDAEDELDSEDDIVNWGLRANN